ncbi:MAG TPA: RpiB/LacA/LacB family sugar-phosphate isomerase [Candidatus Paceibacterota bacterium]|nr:RpiB/LacA/LacB family sugar-phosphate isomerase [Candidatus Paceibacterota bacterium]
MIKVFLASDHAGYEMKEALNAFLSERGFAVEDLGPASLDPQDDYPDYLMSLGRNVAENKGSFGIGIGGSGQGEAMAANRTPGARAAVFYGGPDDILTLSRQHNDANILSLGARFVSIEQAKQAVALWLATPFSGEERHVRRIQKLG